MAHASVGGVAEADPAGAAGGAVTGANRVSATSTRGWDSGSLVAHLADQAGEHLTGLDGIYGSWSAVTGLATVVCATSVSR
jgi:hypothetical protein